MTLNSVLIVEKRLIIWQIPVIQCGEDLPEGASFCPHCGEEVDESGLICEECGEVISEEDVEKYNQLSLEEKTALREAYLQKKSEEKAKDEALQKEVERI